MLEGSLILVNMLLYILVFDSNSVEQWVCVLKEGEDVWEN